MRKRKVYDCFCFFNELELLELRLNILDDYVDFFVISEANVTHTGKPKPYYFDENKHMFSKFLHKIIHLKIEDTPSDFVNLPIIEHPKTYDECELNKIYNFINTQTERFNVHTQQDYGRDFFQKECVRRGLINCEDDDVIIFSDADEIPNPKILEQLHRIYDTGHADKFFTFNQKFYCYYLNVLKENNWGGSRMGAYKNLKNFSYNQLRAQENLTIKNGGWHFSFLGGADRVKKKITSYSAVDLVDKRVFESVEKNIENNVDPFFRGSLTVVDMDKTYPEYLIKNKARYEQLIKKVI